MGIVDKKTETTGMIEVVWGYMGLHRDNGKENGNYDIPEDYYIGV